MPYQKLQVGRALTVIPTDNNNIPFPAKVVTSVNTSVVASQLVDSAVNFTQLNVQVGDIVYNTTAKLSSPVVNVINATTIQLANDIFLASPEAYTIYQGGQNDGCVLYVGIGANLRVLTVGGDDVIFKGVNSGQFLPVQVLKVFSSGTLADDIIALW